MSEPDNSSDKRPDATWERKLIERLALESVTEPTALFVPDAQDRLQLQSELFFDNPWLRQLNSRLAYTDYQHAEIEDGATGTTFKNRSDEARLELLHREWLDWRGGGFNYRGTLGEWPAWLGALCARELGLFLRDGHTHSADAVALGGGADHAVVALDQLETPVAGRRQRLAGPLGQRQRLLE